jgi:PilZ domain
VKRVSERDRRRHPRFPQVLDIKAQDVLPLKAKEDHRAPVLGRVQNMSKGGICFLSQQPISKSSLLLCEIGVGDFPVAIPSLLQVRWTRKQNLDAESYLSGLKFLFSLPQ